MKKYGIWVLAGLLSFGFTAAAYAEASTSENSVTGFFRKMFNYPGKAAKETVETTGKTLSNTGEKVLSKSGENTQAILKGDVAKTGDLVADNVKGVAETTGQTVAETAQVPVKAAEETQPAATK